MTILQSAVIAFQNDGKKCGKDKLWKRRACFSCMCDQGGRKRRLQMQLALNDLVARRKRFINLACLLVLLISQRNITVPRPVRSRRRLKRNTGWWDNVCNTYSDARFKKTFRVSRDTFNFILNSIAPFLIRQTVTEEPITPAVRLAICLYRLGRGDYLYTISEMSGLGVSTVSSICQEVSSTCRPRDNN